MAKSQIERAIEMVDDNVGCVVFVTPLLRAREIKMATALRSVGWKVVLLYRQTTPFRPEDYFDIAIKFDSDREALEIAGDLRAPIYHVFSGAIDTLTRAFCRNKPGRVVLDLNDIFCPSLFNYLQERFEPTRECLALADALCARDLQAKFAERYDNFTLPKHILLFQEYSWKNGPKLAHAAKKKSADEIHVVSVGTFTVKAQGMTDSSYSHLANLLSEQKIHFHIYPHWFYRKAKESAFNFDVSKDLAEFLALEETSPYIHVHESVPLAQLARELPQYDFGIISGASRSLGQELNFLTQNYMDACYSGRISDYLDARLPVLINKEVSFNYWLLDRLGIAINLSKILEPGFREKLLEIKQSRLWAKNVRQAAARMSLDVHAKRLKTFYLQIMADIPERPVSQPRWLGALEKLPIFGKAFKEFFRAQKREIVRLNYSLSDATFLASNKDVRRISKQSVEDSEAEAAKLREEIVALRGRVGQLRHEVNMEGVSINDIAGLLNWPELIDDVGRNNGFNELLKLTSLWDSNSDASAAWKLLNRKNFDQLLSDGYNNFKRTIAFNYFTFPVQAGDPQVKALEEALSDETVRKCREIADSLPDEPHLPLGNQADYRYFVLLLWRYVKRIDHQQILETLAEPAEGNPILVPFDGDFASQDLANSTLEYYSMRESGAFRNCSTIMEIGGGYGRVAYVILSMLPSMRYLMVDIPPALYIAQRYLSSVLPNHTIFQAREFSDYAEVREEMERASIVFLLPHQLKLLGDRSIDLAINISSFGEMNIAQIERYYAEINRLTKGAFYSKQWKISSNPFDGLKLEEKDYPVRPAWEKVFSRTCAIQTQFFESLHLVNAD